MKNKKLLIGIVSGLILIIIAVVIGLLLGGGKKEDGINKRGGSRNWCFLFGFLHY